jgi:DNA-directed RNA polymerase specialized sigma subunit
MTKDKFSSELKRMAWNLQYRCRVTANKEFGMLYDNTTICSFEDESISKFHVDEIFALIPSSIGKKILHDIYLRGISEKELSAELQISQQAVNKWKKKTLDLLSTKLSS